MLFSWLKKRRRRKLLETPFPAEWLEYLDKNVTHYAYLSEAEQTRLRDDLRVFIAEKNWEGCGGLKMTDEIKVTIAAQACLLVLGIEHKYYDRVKSILVYPRGYEAATEDPLGGGLIVEPHQVWLGEAHYRGPVILSWADVLSESRHARGKNTVFHEFAHQLDFLNGEIDGTPPLFDVAQYRKWREVMTAEFNRLRKDADGNRPTLLDPYGATNESEFFAVATECFFEEPVELARQHPRLYALLRDYYHQDPARRCADRPAE